MLDSVKTLVILAAGMGSRIRVSGQDRPKPLVKVGGLPLLKRTILTARKAGVERFVVILGYERNLIRDALGDDADLASLNIDWVDHERFDLKNGVSVLQAQPYVDGEFFLTMADHVVDPKIYTYLNQAKLQGDLALAVDYKISDTFDMDDATKVKVGPNHQIAEIDKQLVDFDAIDTGVFRCTPRLFDALHVFFEETGDVSLSQGVKVLADQGKAHVVNIEEAWWQDVDDLSTRDEAERRLFKSLTKSVDGPVSKHINRRFSKMISRLLMNTNVIPNHMTTVGLIIGILSAIITGLATVNTLWLIPLGGFLYQVSSMIDWCDGEIARLKFMHSDWGEWYDTISDDVINLGYQLAMGIALYRITGESGWLWLSSACFIFGWVVCFGLYRTLNQSGQGTHLAIEWSFEENQESWFQKICARCGFIARRDFYALVLMCLSFLGPQALKVSISLSALTILFIVGQWITTFLTPMNNIESTASTLPTRSNTQEWMKVS
jgi:CDP-L-myo-inositol myo-inositolphosphotransferase